MAPFRKNLSFIAIDLDRAMRRTPALVARQLREVVDMFEAGKLFPLSYRTFPITNIRGAFRYMAHGKHLGKIVVSLDARHRPVIVRDLEERQCVSADATYLVTGGLTGFGLAAAQWLLQQGARHLVLASRRGLDTPGAEAEVAVMQQSGAEIVVHQTDVSDSAQVAGMIQRIEQTMPPLRGVVHAAMVLDDCQLLNLTPERWHRVQAPKATGAWNLHLQTQHLPLDFFVCFSSMSSVFGFAGQSNYAAANAVLDGLADYRRAKRLATLTVNWGYLGEVGYVARNEKIGQRFDAFGLHSISRAEAFSLLAQLIRQRVHRAGAMRVDWPNFRIPGISDKLSPRFADLAARAEAASIGQETDSVSARQLVLAAAGDERKELLESLLRKKVARVLGASPSDLDSQKPLNELGLDSIMGVELRNWIADDLRIDLPAVELVRGPSMDHLVNLLLAKLSKESDTAASTSVESNLPPQPEPDAATAQVAALSNEEVDQMLKAMSADRSK
jgi:NAD(P)-dependent dehydrogenase (short-subunit alcohol dehydrogenase family)/aryl carrier-like protein